MPKKSLLPFFILAGGFLWYGLTAWVRRQPWMRNAQAGGGPSESGMVLLGLLGLIASMIAAAVVAYQKW